mmetsp:Transcript_13317/g.40284  ORF Transcript_13317/g.40284 Transcript_13317/m.40284 type:complete len:351 (-) Transcript_13317:295-1347(-)
MDWSQFGGAKLFVGLYVDDFVLISVSLPLIEAFKAHLALHFEFKDPGPLTGREFLGIHVDYDPATGAHLSSDRYIREMLLKYDMGDSSRAQVLTPSAKLEKLPNLAPASSDESTRTVPVPEIVGAVNWLAITVRPELTTATSMVASANLSAPTVDLAQKAKRLLRYLRSGLRTPGMGLHYSARTFASVADALTPVAYADSDHARHSSRRSRSGSVVYLCGAPIYWRSALQKSIQLHSTSAEIVALSDAAKKVVWITTLLGEFGFPLQSPVVLWEDNIPAIATVQVQRLSARMRHIDVRHLWLRELEDRKIIDIRALPSADNIADFFTKVLPKEASLGHISKLVSPLSAVP